MECPLRFVNRLTITTSKVIFVSINTTVMITSVLGNGIVMFVIITRQRLHQPTYYLIFSLALSDFSTALFGQSTYIIQAAFKERTSCFGDKIITFLHGIFAIASLMLLCMISRDRWLHVAKGLRYNEYTSNKQVLIISVACFFISTSVALPYCFRVIYLKILGMFMFTVIAIVCFIAICILNVKVQRLVKRHFDAMENNEQDDGPVNGTRSRQKEERAQVERSVNRSIIGVIMAYGISWFPLLILLINGTVHSLQNNEIPEKEGNALKWAATIAYFNGAINPFIYAYRCDDIGRELRVFVLNMKRKVIPGTRVEPF